MNTVSDFSIWQESTDDLIHALLDHDKSPERIGVGLET